MWFCSQRQGDQGREWQVSQPEQLPAKRNLQQLQDGCRTKTTAASTQKRQWLK